MSSKNYIPLEELLAIKMKRYPALFSGKYARMKAISSLLTHSPSTWDKFGNIISTDPDILSSEEVWIMEQKPRWARKKQERIEDIEQIKKDIEERDWYFLKEELEFKEAMLVKHYNEFEPYSTEWEDIAEWRKNKLRGFGAEEKEETVPDITHGFTGYGTLTNIPDNATEESIEIVMEYLDFIIENYDATQEIKDIRKNVISRFYRHKRIDELLS